MKYIIILAILAVVGVAGVFVLGAKKKAEPREPTAVTSMDAMELENVELMTYFKLGTNDVQYQLWLMAPAELNLKLVKMEMISKKDGSLVRNLPLAATGDPFECWSAQEDTNMPTKYYISDWFSESVDNKESLDAYDIKAVFEGKNGEMSSAELKVAHMCSPGVM